MLKVAVDHILSLTEARSRLSELVERTEAEQFWVLTKGGKPRVAIVDVDYLNQLIRLAWFNDLASRSQMDLKESFENQEGQKSQDPDMNGISETEPRSIMAFAGSWRDMSEQAFEGFVEEVAERRQRAFSRRRSDENSVA